MSVNFNELIGKTIIKFSDLHTSSERIKFWTSDGFRYEMYHDQDCCESVHIDDIIGDPEDILFQKLLLSEESSNSDRDTHEYESCTWTFYRLGTIKGHLDIKWFGSSNGYYSESVTVSKHEDVIEVRDFKIENIIN